MSNTLYVANLSHACGRDDLERLFAAHGAVRSAELIAQFKTAGSTGAGLVRMGSDEHAAAAVAALNGTRYLGGTLTVGWAEGAPPEVVVVPRMFESMNVPADAEGEQPPGAAGRDCVAMRP